MKTIIKTINKVLSKSRRRYCKISTRKQIVEEKRAFVWIPTIEQHFKMPHLLLSTKTVFLRKALVLERILL